MENLWFFMAKTEKTPKELIYKSSQNIISHRSQSARHLRAVLVQLARPRSFCRAPHPATPAVLRLGAASGFPAFLRHVRTLRGGLSLLSI